MPPIVLVVDGQKYGFLGPTDRLHFYERRIVGHVWFTPSIGEADENRKDTAWYLLGYRSRSREIAKSMTKFAAASYLLANKHSQEKFSA